MTRNRTFAVTGTGRCGTKSVAALLNQSPGWRVEHEPTDDSFSLCRDLQSRFAIASLDSNYGEVNSWLRFAILALEVDAKAIVVRDPVEVFLSMVRKNVGRCVGQPARLLSARKLIPRLNMSLHAIDAAINAGVPFMPLAAIAAEPVRFGRMVGVELPSDASLPILNENERPEIVVPKDLEEKAAEVFEWFRKEYL